MASEASTNHVDVLERILLDESAEPTNLPLSLLKDITNCFSADHEIGSGGFAVVYKGFVGKGMVAVKKLSNTFGIHENKFQEEVKCLIKAKHKNIVRFLGYCADAQGKMKEYEGNLVMAEERNWLLCFDYACNGSLDQHITGASDGLNWRQRYQIIRGICEGLLFLHDERIIHLDFKPANILLDGYMVPKIADFCLSRILSQVQTCAMTENIHGALGYMDPEYITSGQITFASDIYSLSVIIIEIMTGARQYFEDGHVVESWRIRLEALEGDMQLEQVRVCYKIAIECMDLDPKKRPVARHIVNRLDKTASVVYSGKTTIGTHQVNVLERLLFDESAEPTNLPLSLLQDITNHFSLDHQIGCGGFAVVYKGVVGKGTVAVKKLSNTYGIHEKKFQDEIKCLIKAKHKNIVRFLGYCADAQGKMKAYEGDHVMAEERNWLLCFDYACNGSLDKHITDATCGLNWRIRYQIIRGVSKGLVFLREKGILHLDLKPANILLDGHMIPKIADFGLSRSLGQAQTSTITENILGTKGYMDPESIRSGQIGFASDVYSLGVIIMEILTGKRQYRKDENAVERWMSRLGVSEGDMQLKQVRVCSEIAVECMDLDPEKRPDACHIIDRLDKIEGTDKSDETGINNSLIQLQGSLPREQSGESVGKPAAESLQVDVKEHSEILEDVADSLELLHSQEGQQNVDELSSYGVQETKQKVDRRGTSISSSISTVFHKLNSLNIFSKKASRKLHNNDMYISGKSYRIKLFKKKELKPIIKSINLIGKGAFTEVYKGVVDNTLVAVKIPGNSNLQEGARLANEVIIQSTIQHKNVVRLIGCCLEIDNPMLVYEFVSNGSVDDVIHGGNRAALNLDVRLNIVAESAQGLAYLHSQADTKILHGDVKPRSVLLDENFVPKIAGFGLSKLITGDKEHTANIIGDMSYMDPIYLQTGRLTLKSDVYSFGVVILELISGKKPRHSDNHSLVRSFLEVQREGNKATELFDKEIAVTTEDLELLDCLAEIAVECLSLDVDERPTMTDVAERLLMLNRSRRSQAV